MEILSPVSVRDSSNSLRKVARVQNTDGDPGDTLFVGNTTPTQTTQDGDVWLNGEGAGGTEGVHSASSFVSLNASGTAKVDVPGVVVSPYCTGAPARLSCSTLMQVALNGAALGTVIQGQAWITDQDGRTWNILLAQGYATANVHIILTLAGSIVIPNITPGRHMFKMQVAMSSVSGALALFAGSFEGDPVWETNLTYEEIT